MNDIKSIIESLKLFIDRVSEENKIPDVMLRSNLNETWFSDTLAWLLDPKSGDKTGVKFMDQFISLVAKKRSCEKDGYRRRDKYLKSGKQGKGRSITAYNRFSLKNAAVIREFYLSRSEVAISGKGAQYCDIVIIDLDPSDGIILVIENKLFSTNHPYQLENYYKLIEEKYKSVKTLEYVYLTLLGDEPIVFGDGKSIPKIIKKDWVRISWVNDILPILENITETIKEEVEDLKRIRIFLSWIKGITDPTPKVKKQIEYFAKLLVETARDCLVDELNRLCKKGKWEQKDNIKSSIKHSSLPASVLYVQMLPNMSITVQGKKRSKDYYEKILIPFGAYPDQVFHMMDIAAREIYYKHFSDVNKYLNNNHKLTVKRTEAKETIKPLLEFLYKYKNEIQVLLFISKLIRNANIVEEIRNSYDDDQAVEALEKLELGV